MIIINSIGDAKFSVNGKQYGRFYQPLAQGLESISIVNIYDTRQVIVNSIHYSEFTVNGTTYTSQYTLMSALLLVIYTSVGGGGSGGGGAWGDITGTIGDQGDLMSELNGKSDVVHSHPWSQITGTPTTSTGYGITDITNPTGLEKITEGSNSGLAIVGRIPANFGNIGQNAIDLSTSATPSTTRGATGNGSIAIGSNLVSANAGTIAIGDNNSANNIYSIAVGRYASTGGNYATAIGYGVSAYSLGETAIGMFSVVYTPSSTSTFVASDRIFNIGNGTNASIRSNAFTILKSGLIIAPSLTTSMIDSGPDNSLISKEWFNLKTNSFSWSIITSKPTTISGYGITDAYTKTEANGRYLLNTTDTLTGNLDVTGVMNGRVNSITNNSTSNIGFNSGVNIRNTSGSGFGTKAEITFQNAGNQNTTAISSEYKTFSGGQYGGELVFSTKKAGTNTQPVERLRVKDDGISVSGKINATGRITATEFYESSDARLKKDIEAISPTFSSYSFKNVQGKRYGVIAQELQAINPELVNEDSEGMLSVNYTDLHSLKLAEQENEIKELNNKVDRLEFLVEQLLKGK